MIQFTIDGAVVGQTRSRSQRTIKRLALALAEQHVGREVHIIYPERCPECGGEKHQPLCQWYQP